MASVKRILPTNGRWNWFVFIFHDNESKDVLPYNELNGYKKLLSNTCYLLVQFNYLYIVIYQLCLKVWKNGALSKSVSIPRTVVEKLDRLLRDREQERKEELKSDQV
jgi:hypothetical protein